MTFYTAFYAEINNDLRNKKLKTKEQKTGISPKNQRPKTFHSKLSDSHHFLLHESCLCPHTLMRGKVHLSSVDCGRPVIIINAMLSNTYCKYEVVLTTAQWSLILKRTLLAAYYFIQTSYYLERRPQNARAETMTSAQNEPKLKTFCIESLLKISSKIFCGKIACILCRQSQNPLRWAVCFAVLF